jgi:hypothetical protein
MVWLLHVSTIINAGCAEVAFSTTTPCIASNASARFEDYRARFEWSAKALIDVRLFYSIVKNLFLSEFTSSSATRISIEKTAGEQRRGRGGSARKTKGRTL